MINALPFPAILLNDYLDVIEASCSAYELFHIAYVTGEDQAHAETLSKELRNDADLIASAGAATLRLDRAGCVERFSWSRDGRQFEVTVCVVAAEGQSARYGLFFNEQTEQVLARQGEARIHSYLETMMHSLYLGIVVSDRNLRITQINRAQAEFSARETPGFSTLDAVGMMLLDLFPDEEDLLLKLVPAVLDSGEAVAGIIKTTGQKAGGITYSIGFSPVRDETGQISGLLRICEDISEKKMIEDELRRAEVKAREMEVVQELLATLHHEINTSLTKIIGHSDLLMMISCSATQEDILSSISEVKTAAERIELVTKKLGSMKTVKSTEYLNDGTKMIDIYDEPDSCVS